VLATHVGAALAGVIATVALAAIVITMPATSANAEALRENRRSRRLARCPWVSLVVDRPSVLIGGQLSWK
jgi:hypothetical protein